MGGAASSAAPPVSGSDDELAAWLRAARETDPARVDRIYAAACAPAAAAAAPEAAATAPAAGEAAPGASERAPEHAFLTRVELDALTTLNEVRTSPGAIADELEREWLPRFDGTDLVRADGVRRRTQEGAAPVQEAIAQLRAMAQPLAPLAADAALALCARVHAADNGLNSATGHAGSDGSSPSARAERFGQWGGTYAENLAYGANGGRDLCLQLVVDDGVPSRGHRANILNADVRVVGLGEAEHRSFGRVLVQCFATSFAARADAADVWRAERARLVAAAPPDTTPKCSACGGSMAGRSGAEVNGAVMHAECMLCEQCQQPANTIANGRLMCAACIEQARPRCDACGEAISGRYVKTSEGKSLCEGCSSSL